MILPRRLACLLAALLGLLLGATAAVRASRIEPFLAITTVNAAAGPAFDIWGIHVEAKGGPVYGISIELPPGWQDQNGRLWYGVEPDRAHSFRIMIPRGSKEPRVVTLRQSAPMPRTYAVTIGPESP